MKAGKLCGYDALWHGKFTYPGWSKDENIMITCCNDGVRPVIFKMELV